MTPCRTFLFAPGNHARRVEKAFTLAADAVILDLEDAVASAEKPAARPLVLEALARPRRCRGYVRVNAMSTEWGYGDLVAMTTRGVDGIVLPKLESADEIKAADWVIGALERQNGLQPGAIDLLPIIETAVGFTRLEAIARAGTRVKRLAFGAGDFTFDLGITWSREEPELLPYRSAFVAISRAAGLEAPIDTVWVDLRDTDGFDRSVARAKALGFQGKFCIHPDQVPVANRTFGPDAESVARARRVVAAFEQAEAQGLASIQLDGRFIDYPIVYAARRTVAQAEAIAASKQHHE
ncbi:MAG: CoA ester lyase [Pseudomonadota bacterium]|nr:CoA ester lyase [Pseudomonadota bacterium]